MVTIVIACRNDPDIVNTVESIRRTAGNVPIIVVDDNSNPPVVLDDSVKVLRTGGVGVGPCRHMGILAATTKWVLITDAHMRFTEGWLDKAQEIILPLPPDEGTMLCGQCLALTEKDRDLAHHKGIYNGGTFNLWGPDPQDHRRWHALEAIWARDSPDQDMYELPAVMGACYLIPRGFYLSMGGGLQYLRTWGGDETCLSLKTWLCGGSIRMCKSLKVGHVFWDNKRKGFNAPEQDANFNRIWNIATLLPPELANRMIQTMGGMREFLTGYRVFMNLAVLAKLEQQRNASVFTRDFRWFIEKFKLPFSLK